MAYNSLKQPNGSHVQNDAARIRKLTAIKLAHTAIWALIAGCIVALPLAGAMGRFRLVAVFTAVVAVECGILAANHARCPLTDLAQRYTDDRRPNFDIFMPEWLARYNKQVFGALFLINELIVLAEWAARR